MNFENFYNDTYHDFYNACKNNNLISNIPIPYEIDASMPHAGSHTNGVIKIKDTFLRSHDDINRKRSLLYHEFTHYYDSELFKHYGYKNSDIDTLMLTFSEIHASYNGTLAFFNCRNLSIKNKISTNRIVFENQNLLEFCSKQIAYHISKMTNILGFKRSMYLLGEKRAIFQITKDIQKIYKIYTTKRIPSNIRDEIVKIDSLININNYECIDVQTLKTLKTKVEDTLRLYSMKNIPIPDLPGMDKVKKILDSIT